MPKRRYTKRISVRDDVNCAVIVGAQYLNAVVLVSLNYFRRRKMKVVQIAKRNHCNSRLDSFDEIAGRGGVAAVMRYFQVD